MNNYTTITIPTEKGSQTLIMLRPMFYARGLRNVTLRMFIPLKYFRKELGLYEAQKYMVKSFEETIANEGQEESHLDFHQLNRDGFNGLLSLVDCSDLNINPIVVPSDYGWIEIENFRQAEPSGPALG